MNTRLVCLVLLLCTGLAAGAVAQSGPRAVGDGLGVRGGIGADVTFGGVAFGLGVNHLILDSAEAGLQAYYGKFEETSESGGNTYEETTEVTVFAALLNYLYGYEMGTSAPFLVGGIGLAYVGVYWEERSDTDTSLGTPLDGGGSMQDFEGGVGGMLFNVGGGYAFDFGLDLRLEVPVMVTFGAAGGASGVIPLFTLTGGYRFSL